MRRAGPLLLLLLLGATLPVADARAEDAGLERAIARTRAGAQAFEQGAVEEAIRAFRGALEAAPDDANARRNLALALARRARSALRAQDAEGALARIERALELHPGRLAYGVLRARALLAAGRPAEGLRQAEAVTERSAGYAAGWAALAEVQERMGALPDALVSLERVRALRPRDEGVARHLALIARRAEAEAGFATHGTGNFVARYDPEDDAGEVQLALTILEDAYSHVTADLGLAPRTPAQVVLYGGAEFQRVTGAHSWVGALYQGGTLRVPIRNLGRHRETARRVLTHEFTHHVLRERAPTLPIWWHEGIAQHLEDDREAGARRRAEVAEQLRRQRAHSRLLTLEEMQRTVITRVADAGMARLYYGQALSFVGWLVDARGPGALSTFLVGLASGEADLDASARRAFGDTQAGLWKAWLASL